MESIVVDFSPLMNVIIQVLAAALLAVGAWVAKRFADKLGLESDSEIRKYLMAAVENGVAYAKIEAQKVSDKSELEIKSEIVAKAAQYVMDRVPDAIEKFDLSEEAIKQLVQSKLN